MRTSSISMPMDDMDSITKYLPTVYFFSHFLGKTMQYIEVELAHKSPQRDTATVIIEQSVQVLWI
jgi:hypothetical protein